MKATLLFLLLAIAPLCMASEIVVLGETPVAEFMLPDGSVLKNAFVWRRSSEGLMIVHDDGQYFLNYKLLSNDWKTAYLGGPEDPVDRPVEEEIEVADRYALNPVLKTIGNLAPQARRFILREEADPVSEEGSLALALLQSLLTNKKDEARRILLIIEEKGLEIKTVERDSLFSECGTCNGEGRVSRDCPGCGGTGKCSKCDGEGLRKTGIGSSTIHCTTCRGTGECPECKGQGTLSSACRVCRGRGKVLDRQYCEIKRDQFVRTINALAGSGIGAPITKTDPERMKKVFKELPGLKADARAFYFSDAYNGGMDTNIMVACVVHSLLKDRMEEAERFHLMLQAYFPGNDAMVLGDYLKPCPACEATGLVERECRSCDGTGKCSKCGGTGERDSEFMDRTVHCTTCRGTGKCSTCGGDGKLTSRCTACEGTGRAFERQRSRIKLDILVDELNDFYGTHR